MFENIVRSILEIKDPKTIKQSISQLSRVSLYPEEKALLKEIDICVSAGTCPTVQQFLQKYSGTVFSGSFSLLSEDSILSSIALLANERRNIEMSRDLMSIANEITTKGLTETLYKKLSNTVAGAITTKTEAYYDPLENAPDLYEALLLQGEGMKFGVDIIDKAIGGIQPGSVNVVFAYTGHYKTLSAVNFAYSNSFKRGFNVVYISLEVVKRDLTWNIYSRHSFDMHSSKFTYLPHDKMRNGQLTEKEKAFLYDDVIPDFNNNKKGRLYILDETDFDTITYLGFEKRFREMEDLAISQTGKGIDCIVVDHVGLLKFNEKDLGFEGSVINAWVSFFRQQCIDFLGTGRPIAIMLLSQANREGWKRAVKNEGRYDLRAISEANELERAAWRVFSIFTDENMKESKEAKVQCLKNRTGMTVMDPVVIFVDPVCYTFGDVGEGFNDSLSVDSLTDIFSSEFDVDDLFGDEGGSLL